MPEVKQERRKILLVGSYRRMDVENQLVRADCGVVKTDGGAAAVAYAKHDSFSAAVLVSTGREMDLAETALNLKDIQPSMEIIFLTDRTMDHQAAVQVEAVHHGIPKSRILTIAELSSYLTSSKRMRSPREF